MLRFKLETALMRKIELPRISERIRGFTLPFEGKMNVFDYDEVYQVNLVAPVTVEVLADNPYEFEAKTADYFGVSDREPIRIAGQTRVSYKFDPHASSVSVVVEMAQRTQHINFQTLSGDWFVATLTPCGDFLVLAEPYLLEIYAL